MVKLRKPDFFIVGAPKSGTTALYRYLSQHPEIFIPYRKEVHFFGSDLTKIPHEFFVLDEKRYFALFKGACDGQRIGEASVMYLYSKKAAEEIKEFNSSSQVIIMLRNPVDVIYSAHSHNLWGAYEDIPDFEAALQAENERRHGRMIPRCAMLRETLFYRELGKYTEHVRRYFEVFGREKVHVIIFDDFKEDTAEAYQGTVKFLGVDPTFQPVLKIVNRNKKARYRAIQELVQRPPESLRMALKVLPDRVRVYFLAVIARLNSTFEGRPQMASELRNQLCREFVPEVESLSKLLDRDLSHWTKC